MTRCATQDQEIILLRKKIAKVEDLILSSSKPKEKVAYAEKMKKYAKQLEDLLLRQFEGSTTSIFSLQDQEFDDVGYDSSDLQMSYSSLSMDPRGESSLASVLPIPSTPVKKKSTAATPPSLMSTPSSSSTSGCASSSSKSPRQRLPFECVMGVDQNGNRVLKFELSPDKEKNKEDSDESESDSEEEKWKSRKMKVLTARPPRPSTSSSSSKVKKSQSCPSKQDSYEKLLQDMSEEYPVSPTKQRRSWKAKAKSKSTPSSSKRIQTQTQTTVQEDSAEDSSSSSSSSSGGEEEPPFSPRYNCRNHTPRKSSGSNSNNKAKIATSNTSIVGVGSSPKSTMMVVPFTPPL